MKKFLGLCILLAVPSLAQPVTGAPSWAHLDLDPPQDQPCGPEGGGLQQDDGSSCTCSPPPGGDCNVFPSGAGEAAVCTDSEGNWVTECTSFGDGSCSCNAND